MKELLPIQNRGVEIILKDFTYQVPHPQKKEKISTVLNNVSLIARPGETLAIMGPSGSGKSTILNAMAGRLKQTKMNRISGKLTFNQHVLEERDISQISGFVMQSDIFFEYLTVRETLEFCSQLKIKEPNKRKEKIDWLLKTYKLQDCQYTKIGGQFTKVISGGERKRMNICNELIPDPSILFLDEPTSGLDSYTSEIVVTELEKMAKASNKTVIYVIHQPSSQFFAKIDNLCLKMMAVSFILGKPEMSLPISKVLKCQSAKLQIQQTI